MNVRTSEGERYTLTEDQVLTFKLLSNMPRVEESTQYVFDLPPVTSRALSVLLCEKLDVSNLDKKLLFETARAADYLESIHYNDIVQEISNRLHDLTLNMRHFEHLEQVKSVCDYFGVDTPSTLDKSPQFNWTKYARD